MKTNLEHFKRLAVLAVIISASVLGGCGGEESGPAPIENESDGPGLGGALFCFAEVLVSGNDQCAEQALASGGGGGGGGGNYSGTYPSSGGTTTVPERPIYFQAHDETEPNDLLTSANNVYAAFPSYESDRTGFTVDGNVSDSGDVVDAFAYVPRRTRHYRFVLCPASAPDCETRADGRHDPVTVFFRVYDQYGSPMSDTQGGTSAQNQIAMQLTYDVPVYFTVEAGDTMGGAVAYQLRVYEGG